MTEDNRRLAFPDGELCAFSGKLPHMVALASAAGIRNSMEDHHAGVFVSPCAKVIWPGGECQYGDAAKLSDYRVGAFQHAVTRKISEDLHRSAKSPVTWAAETSRNFDFSLSCARKWYLPVEDRELTAGLTAGLRRALPENASRKEVRGLDALNAMVKQNQDYAQMLVRSSEGNQGPARAFDRGKDVLVETEDGTVPWAGVQHITDGEMMAFNIGMADYVLSAYEAMEKVAFERPARQSAHAR